ncbi:MAG: AbrB/MazE/SpoVT family DNA-binding domain-containing protein [Bacillota bacterium]
MKSTGIVRKVDDLGRVVLPKELRKTMDIDVKDPMEFYVEEDKIILKKYTPACYFCGSVENKILYKDKYVCESCIEELEKKV